MFSLMMEKTHVCVFLLENEEKKNHCSPYNGEPLKFTNQCNNNDLVVDQMAHKLHTAKHTRNNFI